MEEKEVLLTQEGYEKLEKELEYLVTEKRGEIADRIKVALGFGDLSENSEYDEAKGAQAANEAKIAELENKIRYAKIIDESEIDTKTVQVGNTVKILDMEFDEELTYTIVGSTEVAYTITKKYQTSAQDFNYATRDVQGRREISLSTCTDDSSGRLIIWAAAD